MFVTLDTSHLEMSPLNDDAHRNMRGMVVTLDTSHLEMSALNDVAPRNIPGMAITFETSHFETSPLNVFALENILLMSVTRDTSHSPMGPCEPVEQSPFGDSFRHASTALWSCALDRGANAVGDRGRGWRAIALGHEHGRG